MRCMSNGPETVTEVEEPVFELRDPDEAREAWEATFPTAAGRDAKKEEGTPAADDEGSKSA